MTRQRPTWLHPLSINPPPLTEAMDAVRAAFAAHAAPTRVCVQCYGEDHSTRFIRAAQEVAAGGLPEPAEFGQMFFEHPGCSGGIEIIKLMLPRGIETMLLGTQPPGFHGYPEVLETAMHAAIWYWPETLRMALRPLATRLFWDWFRDGHYGLDGWPIAGREDDTTGPGDDILDLCHVALIDPAETVLALAGLNTVWATDALILSLYGSVRSAPSYCAPDTGKDWSTYLDATRAITACLAGREARMALEVVTREWMQARFYKVETSHPALAKELSEFENYYDVKTVKTVEAAKADVMMDWPELPEV